MVKSEMIQDYVANKFSQFGPTKRQEITRLLFEISRREKTDYRKLMQQISPDAKRFEDVKSYLLKRRFPRLSKKQKNIRFHATAVDVDPDNQFDLKQKPLTHPNHFYVEESVLQSEIVRNLKKKNPSVKFTTIPSYKDFVGKKRQDIADYNNRTKSFFLIKEKFDFFKPCPCSPESVFCGYHIVNLGSGCAYECEYCYLQSYINSPGIVLPANLEDFFKEFRNYKKDVRVGSGELTDSLIFDHITEYSPRIVKFFRDYPKSTFEFKTKSDNIDLLLTVEPAGNIVVSWSMNPQKIVRELEHYTASLDKRLRAAYRCSKAGYKVVFHFDPVIYYAGWEKDYRSLVNQIFRRIDSRYVAWISLGTLRMTPTQKQVIENRFPDTAILDEEFEYGYDKKMRYATDVRMDIYKKMKNWITAHNAKIPIYLCMEEKTMCRTTEIFPSKALLNEK